MNNKSIPVWLKGLGKKKFMAHLAKLKKVKE